MVAEIAIRKTTHVRRRGGAVGGASRAADEEARRSEDSADDDRLQSVGLRPSKELRELTDTTEPRREVPSVPSYDRFENAAAVVLEASDESQLAGAREVLQEEYVIVPDVDLSVPRPAALGERLDAEAAQDVITSWPDESGIAEAHAADNRGEGVLVVVLDTGCDADHEEFVGRTIPFAHVPLFSSEDLREVRGFDTVNHGTHVAGIIGGNNRGVAPGAEILAVSVIESETVTTSLSRLVRGLDWALARISEPENEHKPALLNLSLGFRPESLGAGTASAAIIGVRQLLMQAVEQFNVLPIVAIGNDGSGTVRAPGYFPETLSIGAVDSALQPAWFSGGGPGPAPFDIQSTPELAGFGVDVVSCIERDASGRSFYQALSGTSMATPYTTGIAALVASATGLEGGPLRDHLIANALPLAAPADRVGAGLARFV